MSIVPEWSTQSSQTQYWHLVWLLLLLPVACQLPKKLLVPVEAQHVHQSHEHGLSRAIRL